jgi:ATP-dependent Lhr-like helicase
MQQDVLDTFHPVVRQWFKDQFPSVTVPQERGWPLIRAQKHTLIAAPTGSGKTFAAFLVALDRLFRATLEQQLEPGVRVVYVSPLRALSNDIHRNLMQPLAEICERFAAQGQDVTVTAGVRTGDTSQKERQALVRKPPHILVTTPESLYLLMTSDSGRSMLGDVDTVIVDEIHAIADSRRGSHLTLTLERLQAHTQTDLQRIGLSATQRPMEKVAAFLTGMAENGEPRPCEIVDEGHLRELDLDLELPSEPLSAVMANETFEEIYDRLIELIEGHHTTLIFVNTRRLAERATFNLSKRLGPDAIASHHGSLSKEIRLNAEQRLKSGALKAIVATASLELGIDIGHVDLVCQIGSVRAISQFLQRVGRSGHYYGGLPKGRLFPLTRDELVESLALLQSVRRGFLDKLIIPEQPLDVLSQQIVAMAASREWHTDELYDRVREAYPYRELSRETFDQVVHMLAEGFSTKRSRAGAHLFYDRVNQRIKGRRGARLTALTCGGAIPDNADYRVLLGEAQTFIGTVNEDFAVESLAGDVFQLGTNAWRITKVEPGKVFVEDAKGQPPNIPFWIAEAPSRTAELSFAVSELRKLIAKHAPDLQAAGHALAEATGVSLATALQAAEYLLAGMSALGVMPSQEDIVLERFFDDAGNMQLVLHAPFGGRLNRAWGLSLRKRFCVSFNFELQAAASEDAIVISLGPKHSFPLEEVFGFLTPDSVRDVLTQAVLDAPLFAVRWRWNAYRALALRRQVGSRRVAPQIQRMEAEDLVSLVFPDQLACLENISGAREIPDHPLVNQTLVDCLDEAMDVEGLAALLQRMADGSVRTHAVEVVEPSVLAHEILNAKPYAFLDDAPLEERRTQAIQMPRGLDGAASGKGVLDAAAIALVREQVCPTPRDEDELHEALWLLGGLRRSVWQSQTDPIWREGVDTLMATGRITWLHHVSLEEPLLVVAERLAAWLLIFKEPNLEPTITAVSDHALKTREDSILELVRGRIETCGPIEATALAQMLGLTTGDLAVALARLEGEGFVVRGYFEDPAREQFCQRNLLARIHRLTLDKLRAQIQPVDTTAFMRFLFRWQKVHPDHRVRGEDGLLAVMTQLEAFDAAAASWESSILPLRVQGFRPDHLDHLCGSGVLAWARLRTGSGSGGPLKTTPISLFFRENADLWLTTAAGNEPKGYAGVVQEILLEKGALFFDDLVREAGLLPTQIEEGLGELVGRGLAHCDRFSGLRSLLRGNRGKPPASRMNQVRRRFGMARRSNWATNVPGSGRWSMLPPAMEISDPEAMFEAGLYRARVLLRRYGVVFRGLVDRESVVGRWRDLLPAFRHMEAIGEIRGGHFVAGMPGEHFALPEAVGQLRRCREADKGGDIQPLLMPASDPLNLTGVLTERAVPRQMGNVLVFYDGVPVATRQAGEILRLGSSDHLSEERWLPLLRQFQA